MYGYSREFHGQRLFSALCRMKNVLKSSLRQDKLKPLDFCLLKTSS